jgi:hypothetical protein
MSIDWSKAPEGTTHYAPEGQGMREQWVKAGPTGEEFDWYSWNEHANCWSPGPLPGGGVPIKRPSTCPHKVVREEIVRQMAGIISTYVADVAAAEALYEAGYRKFEIVEEDV